MSVFIFSYNMCHISLSSDEPELYLKRNVFYDKQDEMRVSNFNIKKLIIHLKKNKSS